MPGIELCNVCFTYRGSAQAALDQFSVRIPAGVTAVIGPNGAGKSTLLRLLAGLAEPSSGTIIADGRTPARLRAERKTGLIPETPMFDGYLTVGEFLEGLSVLTNAPASQWQHHTSLLDKRLATLSLGQIRTVELAAALAGNPSLLLLDEPTNGLDPFAVVQLREFMAVINTSERTILVSSHHLDELQRTADRFMLVFAGHCVGCWNREDAAREFGSVERLFRDIIGNLQNAEAGC